MAIQKFSTVILGILCPTCVSNIEAVLVGVDGVRSSTVDLTRGACDTLYDDDRVTEERILREVESIGYAVARE